MLASRPRPPPTPAPLPDALAATRVSETFENVYSAPGLQVPWYFVAGNHDWVGDVQAQVALNGSAATGHRWVMPSTYYSFTRSAPDGETVQFVMVDTETLFGGVNTAPGVLPPLGYPPSGGRRLRQSSEGDPGAGSALDPPVPAAWVPPAVDEAQWAWVAQVLGSSSADWLVVVGHHPVWSVGEYGPTWALVERLLPLMEASGVALYICGHEHQMEHFRAEPHPSGLDFLVVGNGAYFNDTAPADTSHAGDCPDGALQFQYTEGTGFASLSLSPSADGAPSQLSATLFGSQGQQLYRFYKENPRAQVAGGAAQAAARATVVHQARDAALALLLVLAVAAGLTLAARLAQAQTQDVTRVKAGGPRDAVAERITVWEKGRQMGAQGEERRPLMSARPGQPSISRVRKTPDAL